jgi:hypothetical protein
MLIGIDFMLELCIYFGALKNCSYSVKRFFALIKTVSLNCNIIQVINKFVAYTSDDDVLTEHRL